MESVEPIWKVTSRDKRSREKHVSSFSMLVHQGMLVVLQVVCDPVLPLLATIKPGIVEDPTGSSLFTDV